MNNSITYERYQAPTFFVWAKTGRAVELIWTGNSVVLAVINLVLAKYKYKALVRLEWP